MTHKIEPARQAAFLIIHKGRRREKRVGGSAGETYRGIGGSEYRRVTWPRGGVVGTRSCASGVARPRNVRTTSGKGLQLNARGNGLGRATPDRAGARPYQHARCYVSSLERDTPIRHRERRTRYAYAYADTRRRRRYAYADTPIRRHADTPTAWPASRRFSRRPLEEDSTVS